MAKCEKCGKGPQFGNNRPWSKKATRTKWKVNVQKVKIFEKGHPVSKKYCAACIKSLSKV